MFKCKVCEKIESLRVEQVRYLERVVDYERKRSEEIQSKLDRVLRLSVSDSSGSSEGKSTAPVAIHQISSPSRQRHLLEVESRKKYWEAQVKKLEEKDRETTSRTTEEELEDAN